MSTALQVKTTVLPGHRIEIQVPQLPIGHGATVFLVVDEEQPRKRSLNEVLGDYSEGQLFRSAEEVDDYLREERASWDK